MDVDLLAYTTAGPGNILEVFLWSFRAETASSRRPISFIISLPVSRDRLLDLRKGSFSAGARTQTGHGPVLAHHCSVQVSQTCYNPTAPLPRKGKKTMLGTYIVDERARNYLAIIAPDCLHVQNGAADGQKQRSWSGEEARTALIGNTRKIMDMIERFGRPDRFVVPLSGSILTTDIDEPIELPDPSHLLERELKNWVQQCTLAVEYINILRETAPVNVLVLGGTNAPVPATALLMFLLASFGEAKDVRINNQIYPTQYVAYGNCLLGFGQGSAKPRVLRQRMMDQCREIGGAKRHKTLFTGHVRQGLVGIQKDMNEAYIPALSSEKPGLCATTGPGATTVYVCDYNDGVNTVISVTGSFF